MRTSALLLMIGVCASQAYGQTSGSAKRRLISKLPPHYSARRRRHTWASTVFSRQRDPAGAADTLPVMFDRHLETRRTSPVISFSGSPVHRLASFIIAVSAT
jgi:hypothetical protein